MKINKKKNIVSAIYILLSTCTILIGLILLGSNWNQLMNTIEINSNKKLKEENKSVIEETNSKNTINVVYGDIDEDGKISSSDSVILARYLEKGDKLTEQAKKNADINADNKVNELDKVLLSGVLAGIYEHDITTPLTNYIIYGDIDEDGKITSSDSVILARYLEKGEKLTEQAKKNADINGDGTITKEDSTLLGEFLVDLHKDTLPYKPVK